MGDKIKQISYNFNEVFSNWKFLLFGVVVFILMISLFNYFSEFALIRGNFGETYLYWTIILQFLIALLFAIFLPVSIYKYKKFKVFSVKENSSSLGGTLLGVLVAGCPACSITLASYLGLGSVVALLPWFGLELKILAVPLLLYANYSILRDLQVCKVKNHKKK